MTIHSKKPLNFFLYFLNVLAYVSLFLPIPAFCFESSYVKSLSIEAKRLELHKEPGWLALLHYGKTFTGSYRSKIDDQSFFLSEQGMINAEAELQETLQSFFLEDKRDGKHSICRFPARFAWLSEKLRLDASQLPEVDCSERDAAIGAIEAKSAVLVFPVGHINSPASMFGHTLIRIDGSSISNLISYAVNYSAYNTDSNGLAYAWKGLTGMYKGYFSLMPYYDKVREYNDLEHRDMWEYRLSLTEPETKQMLYHIWELQKIESSYYFLDENCSYNLMFLVEVARPGLRLTDKTGIFVLPSDTVRVMRDNDIIKDVHYRPSQGTKIRNIVSLLDHSDQKAAHDIVAQIMAPSRLQHLTNDNIKQIKILDLAAGFAQFRYSRKELEKDSYNRLFLSILGERSKLGPAPEDLYRMKEPDRPDTGHGTTKLSLAVGIHHGQLFGEIGVRPEFHGLLDPDNGYLPGAQIKFLDSIVRYKIDSKDIRLRSLHLIDILSIAPRDRFFKPLSWKINTGLDEELLNDRKEHLVYRLNTGGGVSYESPFGGIIYGMGELDVNVGKSFRTGVAAGPGISVGMTEQLTGSIKFILNLSCYWYGFGDNRTATKGFVGTNLRLSQNNSLSFETSRSYMNGHPTSEASIRWNYYY